MCVGFSRCLQALLSVQQSKLKPEKEFQFGGRLFFQTWNSYISAVDWVITTKFGLLIDTGLLKRATSPSQKPEVKLREFSCCQGWKWMVHYCDVLLPDIRQSAGDFYFPAHHACARPLSYWGAKLRTSHQIYYGLPSSQQTRPQSCRLQDMDSYSGMCLSETATDVEWHRLYYLHKIE